MSEATDSPTSGRKTNPHAATVRALADAMLRTAVLPGGMTVAVGVLVATFLAGAPGVAGAVVGGVVAFASSLLTIFLMRWTGGMDPMYVMAASLGGYILKMIALLMAIAPLRGVDWIHTEALLFTMLATVLVWAAAEAVAFRKTKIPTIVPGS